MARPASWTFCSARAWFAVAALTSIAAARPHGAVFRGLDLAAGDPLRGGASRAGSDALDWEAWWSLERDALLSPGDPRTGTPGPARAQADPQAVRELVAPVLVETLRQRGDARRASAAVLALAKAGVDPPGGSLQGLVNEALASDDQGVRESALCALGFLDAPEAAMLLAAALHDQRDARRALRRGRLDPRERAFAAYGLAVLGTRTASEDVRRFVVHHLSLALEGDAPKLPDVAAAIVLGLGHVRLACAEPGGDEPAPAGSRQGQIATLLGLLAGHGDGPPVDRSVRPFVPCALGHALEFAPPDVCAPVLAAAVQALDPRARLDDDLRAGWLLAAGRIGDADAEGDDGALRARLRHYAEDGDTLERRLALLALGRAAARAGDEAASPAPAEVQGFLRQRAERAGSGERPWAVLALGWCARGDVAAGRAVPEPTLALLRGVLAGGSSPNERAAAATALGLAGDMDARDALRGPLSSGDETLRGACAVALGMLQDAEALPAVRALATGACKRPFLVRDAALGAVLLGDVGIGDALAARLSGTHWQAELAIAAVALGQLGDARHAGPLVDLLRERRTTPERAAFAAAALGNLLRPGGPTWNSAFASDVPWWSAPRSLHDAALGEGFLDRL